MNVDSELCYVICAVNEFVNVCHLQSKLDYLVSSLCRKVTRLIMFFHDIILVNALVSMWNCREGV